MARILCVQAGLALAFMATAPAWAAPFGTSANVGVNGPQYESESANDADPFASSAQAALTGYNDFAASGLAYAYLGKLGVKSSVALNNYTPSDIFANSTSALSSASFTDALTKDSNDPIGFAKITLELSGSVTGNGGATGLFSDSRFGLSFFASSQDGASLAKFDLVSFLSPIRSPAHRC